MLEITQLTLTLHLIKSYNNKLNKLMMITFYNVSGLIQVLCQKRQRKLKKNKHKDNDYKDDDIKVRVNKSVSSL